MPFDPIDHVLALDLGRRGIAAFFVPRGAQAAAAALRGARRVLIATGFTVAPDTPETDGPPGAVVLGHALRRLGARVRYVTDAHNVPIVEAALKALDEPVEIEVYPEDEGAAGPLLARERPTHLVAVERPGRARSGEYLNLRGEPITAWNRRIDELFVLAHRLPGGTTAARPRGGRTGSGEGRGVGPRARGTASTAARPVPGHGRRRSSSADREIPADSRDVRGPPLLPPPSAAAVVDVSAARSLPAGPPRPVTVGVGDGGNEIGMGNVRRRLVRTGGLVARTASVVRVDHLVVAATSNWGAYGVVAALARESGEDLLHSPDTEQTLIEACVAAGAFDGITRRREPTVDGLGVAVHRAVVALLARAARPVAR